MGGDRRADRTACESRSRPAQAGWAVVAATASLAAFSAFYWSAVAVLWLRG